MGPVLVPTAHQCTKAPLPPSSATASSTVNLDGKECSCQVELCQAQSWMVVSACLAVGVCAVKAVAREHVTKCGAKWPSGRCHSLHVRVSLAVPVYSSNGQQARNGMRPRPTRLFGRCKRQRCVLRPRWDKPIAAATQNVLLHSVRAQKTAIAHIID